MYTFWICVPPLRLGGIRVKQSTPTDWLGGTGVVSMVNEQERRGAGVTRSTGSTFEAGIEAKVWSFIGRIESTRIDVDLSVY